jgi:hypothetical protein
MKKKLFILSLVTLSPLLLSNSPYPLPLPYQDFSYTPIEVTIDEDDDSFFLYSTQITNTGLGYIDLSTYLFQRESNANDTITVYLEQMEGEYLMPSGVFFLSFKRPLQTDDLLLKEVKAFIPDPLAIQVTIDTGFRYDQGSQSFFVPVSYSETLEHSYIALIQLRIDGQPLVIETTMIDDQSVMFTHPLLQSIAITRIHLDSIVLIQGSELHEEAFGLFSFILSAGALISFIFIILIILIFIISLKYLSRLKLRK